MRYEPIPGKTHEAGTEEEILAKVRQVLTDIDIDELEAQQNPILRVVNSISARPEPKPQATAQKEALPDIQAQEEIADEAEESLLDGLLRRRTPLMFGGTVLALVGCAWVYAV